MIKSNIKILLTQAGIEEVRPTDLALEQMEISRRRFTQLLENSNKTPITVGELEAIKNWIEDWQQIDTNALVGNNQKSSDLTDRLGLIK